MQHGNEYFFALLPLPPQTFLIHLFVCVLPFFNGLWFEPGGHQQANHEEIQAEACHAGGDEGLCGRHWTGAASSGIELLIP